MTNKTISRSSFTAKAVKFGFCVLVGGALFMGATHNLQPWISLGSEIASSWEIVPTFGLGKLPMIGEFFTNLANAPVRTLGMIFGGTLWGITQFCQVLPQLIDNPEFMQDFVANQQYHGEFKVKNDGSFIDNMKKRYNTSPEEWWKFTWLLAGISYLVEFGVAFFRYPPYAGGAIGLWSDITNGLFSLALLEPTNLVMMLVTMFAIEAIVYVALHLWKGIRHFGVRARNMG